MRKACKLLTFFAYIVTITTLTTSCWDAKQLEDLYLVYGIGIDVSQDDPSKFLVTIVAPSVHPEATEPKLELFSEGISLRNAQDNIQNKAARRITFANTNIFFLGEAAAERGIQNHLDSLLRDPEGRGTIRLVVTEGRAVDLMNIDPPTVPLVSLYIKDILKRSYETSTVPIVTLRSFNNALETDGIEPVIPYIKYGNKTAEFLVNTIALFKEDKMIGKLEGVDSSAFMLLRGEVYDGFISIPYPLDDSEEHPTLTLRVMRGSSKITVSSDNNRFYFDHEVSIVAHISEFTPPSSVFDEKVIEELEAIANVHIEEICSQVILKLQRDYENDNIGYGRYVKVKHPDIFDPDNWNKQFAGASINIKPRVKIQMMGTKQ